MAITTCSECAGRVSDEAATCPHCGAVFNPSSNVSVMELRIGWGSMADMMFKFAICLIPIGILVGIIYGVIVAAVAGMGR